MEQRIKARYSDSILHETMQRYGIAAGQIRPLDAFESFIFEFERGGAGFILRLGHSLRRNQALINGEADWLNHLADGGLSVARAIPSENGNLVEMVEDGQGGQFLAAAFVKARGRRPWLAGWTPTLYETFGELLGGMHARTIDYLPADPSWKRPEWDDEHFEFVDHFLPPSEIVTRQKYQILLDHLHSLPKEEESYGLIHQDAHGGNMLVDDTGRITLFDFDDCAYSWFIHDIAIVLFYISMDATDAPAFTQEFMSCFLKGYRRMANLDLKWLQEIPYFLKLRELELYAVIHRDFDVNNIDNAWCARFMQQRKQKIEQDVPFIGFDFNKLSPLLTGHSNHSRSAYPTT
jgi:Ser/Thr protein kinase RdoA (MazF antagonist)